MRRLHPWMSSRYLATAAPCVRTAPAPGATIHSLPRVATPAAARWNQPGPGPTEACCEHLRLVVVQTS